MLTQIALNPKKVSENFKKIRLQAGFTQVQLGLKIQVGANYVSQIERGLRFPSIKRLSAICDILNVDISEFFKKP